MHAVILGIITTAAALTVYAVFVNLTRPDYALEVDATRDTTDISGTQYRIRIANVGTERLTGIIAVLGADDVQHKDFLDPGQTFYFYPLPETPPGPLRVTANEGIEVITDYRTPAKTIGLPGAGR